MSSSIRDGQLIDPLADLAGNRAIPVDRAPVEVYITHLEAVLGAVSEVATSVQLLAACRYAPTPVIEAAVADLADALRRMQTLGPAGGHRTLRDLEAELKATSNGNPLADPRIEALRAAIARCAADIEADSADLSLELKRLMADLRDVVSIGTGSTGTYDASGRKTLGDVRRRHAVM